MVVYQKPTTILIDFGPMITEVGEWSEKNFGSQPPINPFIGILEELGEFSHHYLKSQQGIRGSYYEHNMAMRDAIADTFIFLMDWLYRNNYLDFSTLGECHVSLPDTHAAEDVVENLFACYRQALVMERDAKDSHPCAGAVEVFIARLVILHYTVVGEPTFATLINSTWGKVSQRDWKANPNNANVVAEAAVPLPNGGRVTVDV